MLASLRQSQSILYSFRIHSTLVYAPTKIYYRLPHTSTESLSKTLAKPFACAHVFDRYFLFVFDPCLCTYCPGRFSTLMRISVKMGFGSGGRNLNGKCLLLKTTKPRLGILGGIFPNERGGLFISFLSVVVISVNKFILKSSVSV